MSALYVHIPFCHAKCAYCDFYSTPDRRRVDDTIDAIVNEFAQRKYEIDEPRTLYFGGGTPSILPPTQFRRLAHALHTDTIEEFTVEANPEDITPELCHTWVAEGVNRVSMGIQSFVDDELSVIGRRHSADDATKAFRTIRQAGIANISLDLIYGLPGQTLESWAYSFRRMIELEPEHFSTYCLSYEPGTALYLRLQRGSVTEAPDSLVADMYDHLCAEAAKAGFEHYEISNFARPGFHSRHNSSYWDGTAYLGIGPGAHSCDTYGIRRFNPSSLKTYLDNEGLICEIDKESDTDRLNDCLITGLRTAKGLDSKLFPERERKILIKRAATIASYGTLIISPDGHISIPEKHWLTADATIRELLFDQ